MLRHAHTRRLGQAHGPGCAAGRCTLRHAEEVPRASAARRRARAPGNTASQLQVGCAPGRRIAAGCAAGCSPCAAPAPLRPPRQRSEPAWARWQQPTPGSPGWRGAAHDAPHVTSDRPPLVPQKARGAHLAHLALVLNREVALQVGERPKVALPAVAAGQALNWRLCPKKGCHPHSAGQHPGPRANSGVPRARGLRAELKAAPVPQTSAPRPLRRRLPGKRCGVGVRAELHSLAQCRQVPSGRTAAPSPSHPEVTAWRCCGTSRSSAHRAKVRHCCSDSADELCGAQLVAWLVVKVPEYVHEGGAALTARGRLLLATRSRH